MHNVTEGNQYCEHHQGDGYLRPEANCVVCRQLRRIEELLLQLPNPQADINHVRASSHVDHTGPFAVRIQMPDGSFERTSGYLVASIDGGYIKAEPSVELRKCRAELYDSLQRNSEMAARLHKAELELERMRSTHNSLRCGINKAMFGRYTPT
jgi:hypothetical protein